MPRRAAKATPAGKHRDKDENGEGRGKQALTLPRAGDTARQIGMGFLKMADVVDECPPLAKLFEGGLERFQEVFQAPGGLLAGPGAGSRPGASDPQDHTKAPAGAKRKLIGGPVDIEGGGGGGSGGAGGRGGATGAGGSGSSPPQKGVSWSEEGARGRRGTRDARSNIEAEAWPGLEQALKASKQDMAASAGGRGGSKGVGVRSRPADQKAKDESAKQKRKPSPPVPAAFGFPAAPPPRSAAVNALQRIAAAGTPRKPTHLEPKSAAAGADGAAGFASAGGKNTNSQKEAGAEEGGGNKSETSITLAASRSVTAAAAGKKPTKGGPGGSRATPAPEVGGAHGDGASQGSGGSGKLKGGGTALSELAGGPGKRCTTGEDMLSRLDARVFRFVEAGGCREEGCELRDEAHCHRGPGCDCTRNNDTYRWPSDREKIKRHQARHQEWSTKPALGKRVLVEFEGGSFYAGTINTSGDSEKDRNHSKGKWGVLFDDCTRDRFADGATDVMISNRSKPTEFSRELYDYYLRHQNGRKLLEGVKVVPETKRDEAARVAGETEQQGAAGKASAHKEKGAGAGKHRRPKPWENNKPRKESPATDRDEVGGASGKLKHATAGEKLAGTGPEATSASEARTSGASGGKNKRKHSIASEDEETDIELEEQETGATHRKGKGKSGGAADDGGGGVGDPGKKKGAGDSGGGCGGITTSSSKNSAGTTIKYKSNDPVGAVGTGSGDEDGYLMATVSAISKKPKTSGGGHSSGVKNVSHKMASKAAKQKGGGGGGSGGGEGGGEDRGEDSGVRGREGFRGGASKRKKSKKARRKHRQSSNEPSNSDGGDGEAEGNSNPGSVFSHQFERGQDAVVLPAPDSPDLGAIGVAEGGGGGGGDDDEKGEDDHDGVELDWVSPTFPLGSASPSPNGRQEQSPLAPRPQQQQQQQPKLMIVSEEEERTEEDDEGVRAVGGRLGETATYHGGAANTASPVSSAPGAAGGAGSGTANVVPVLNPPTSAATADSATLSVARVLVSRLMRSEQTT